MLASRVSGHIGGRVSVTRRSHGVGRPRLIPQEGRRKKAHGLLQLAALFTQALNQRRIITEGNTSSQKCRRGEGLYIGCMYRGPCDEKL